MTQSAWEQAENLAEQHANQGSIFVRLSNHGDKAIGAFCGEPHAREVVWTGERYEVFDPAVHTDKRPSLRVMLNFYVPDEKTMKVVEGGTLWFKDVVKVRNKYGLDKWLFEIERRGESGDSKTRYTVLPERQIDTELKAEIDTAELHDLDLIGNSDDESAAETDHKPSNNSAIDARTASELVALLKTLPRSDVDAFLAEFKVQRVRDIQAKDEQKARDFIKQIAASHQSSEIDPFL